MEAEGGHEGDAGEDVVVRLTASVQEVSETQRPEHSEPEVVVHARGESETTGAMRLICSDEVDRFEVVLDQSLDRHTEVVVDPHGSASLGAKRVLLFSTSLEAAVIVHDTTEQAEPGAAVSEHDSAADMRHLFEVHDGRDPEVESRVPEPPVGFCGERLAHQSTLVFKGDLGLALEVKDPERCVVRILLLGGV